MHEWPNDLDVNILFIGKELRCITFDEYSFSLWIGEDTRVNIMSNYIYSLADINEEGVFPLRKTYLISSIGSRIMKADLVDKKDLHLSFEDGAELEINGSTSQYDCYSVNYKDREFEV